MDDDLAIPLENSATWLQLKRILLSAVLQLPDDTERLQYFLFIQENWPGHVPRSREIATMTSKMTLLSREKERLVKLLSIPEKK